MQPKVIRGLGKQLLPVADGRVLRHATFAAHARACVTKPGENSNRFSSCAGT
jgi:hypothetical protein